MKKTITLFLIFLSLQNYAQCWQTISSGIDHTLAIKPDGTLWAWGENGVGQLGDGSDVDKNVPVQIGTANNWKEISAGTRFSLAIKTDGTLWAWGNNALGQLGDGTNTRRYYPVRIGTATDWKSISASAGTLGGHSLAIKTNGTLWAWGFNSSGQLGNGSLTSRNQPVQVGTDTNWNAICAGSSYSVAIKVTGTLWAWGNNVSYQLGDGTGTSKLTPTQIGTATNWKSIDTTRNHTLGIKTDGTLWTWGFGSEGQLGLGTVLYINVPTQVGSDNDWAKAVAGDDHSLALKTNGTLWSWGKNESGELGLGTNSTTDITVPTQVNTNADKTLISTGGEFSLIMNADGFLYATGFNADGELGDGTNTNKNTLTPVICTALGVNEFGATKVNAYPNPVRDLLHLSYGQGITMVSIYNLLGQEVFSKSIQDNEAALDLSALSPGTYLVKVASATNTQTLKIVKQ
ncbi:T9SS type A sorting domain-containing protein [Flavobacterium sp. WW92]|uniref:RCC1 domain-containing protein n=1 Tax=unclassified Flavobacterium TaxID=196869 RepID=UPI002224A27F|nr:MULTISPECIES: T9SS type A sorting domain-containing protein [unclassified Flavobacterium]WDO11909.1 T9SS type A sorting domain-containing protein [Flavobacterium sp. WW92]